jgi:hypothetical protein
LKTCRGAGASKRCGEKMIEFYDISDWPEKPHFQTGGTRNKVIVENPGDENLYYFKTSLKRTNDEYKHEF